MQTVCILDYSPLLPVVFLDAIGFLCRCLVLYIERNKINNVKRVRQLNVGFSAVECMLSCVSLSRGEQCPFLG